MRRILSLLLLGVLIWSTISPFVSVTHDVKAEFVRLGSETSIEGGKSLRATMPAPVGFFAIAYSTHTPDIEYVFESRYRDPQNATWSDWETLYTDHDMTTGEDGKQFSQLTFTPRVTEVEIRLPASEADEVYFTHLELITFVPEARIQVGLSALKAQALKDGLIVTREEWGADNRYLYAEGWNAQREILCKDQSWYCASSPAAVEATRKKSLAVAEAFPNDVKIETTITSSNGNELAWPVQKSDKINKLFVHHTANVNKDQNGDGVINRVDEEIAVRGIYYYHSIVRGWGDIGYNYLVGASGTIYEGRFGGDKVVAAHAVWRNISSAGVSALGNFESDALGDAQRAGIATALAYLSKKYGLDPSGTSLFYGKTTHTILGHRDSDEASTACPGRNIYTQMDTLRRLAKDAFNGVNVTPSGPVGGVTNPAFKSSFSPTNGTITFEPGETKTLSLTLTNTGTETWDTSTFLALQNKTTTGIRILSGDKTPAKAALIPSITPSGDSATFSVTLQARQQGFNGSLQFLPIAGGKYSMTAFEVPVFMKKGTVSYADGTTTLQHPSHTFAEPIRGTLTVKNSGNTTWEAAGDQATYFDISVQGADGKMNTLPTPLALTKDILPGQTLSLPFDIAAPLREGPFDMAFSLRIRGDGNLFGTPLRANTTIFHPGEQSRLKLAFNAQATPDLITHIDTAGTFVVYVTNTGTSTWENLSVLEPTLRTSSEVAAMTFSRGVFDERNLAAGKTTALRFPYQTEYVSSESTQNLSLDLGGKTFLSGLSKKISISDKKIAGNILNPNIPPSSTTASLQIQNTGDVTWKAGKTRLQIGESYSIPLLGTEHIAPGKTATFEVRSEIIPEGTNLAAGINVGLLLEGRTTATSLGQIVRKVLPTIPLEFGESLTRIRIRL